MATTTIKLTKEEIVKRGNEIYENTIRSKIEDTDMGKVVAIDILSGEFEVANNAITSSSQLRSRLPDALIFVLRVGYPSLHRTS